MEIERENRLLLEKMSMIVSPRFSGPSGFWAWQFTVLSVQMESGRPEMASANTVEFAPGTRLDRHQYPMVGSDAMPGMHPLV
jgi:hypothetical protein